MGYDLVICPGKCDLKSVRLVSKTWAAFATEFLFDQVYVSAHPENLEVFNAITQHTLLSKCVKTLIYDAVDFVENYTKNPYILDLQSQTDIYLPADLPRESYESSELGVKAWTELLKSYPPHIRDPIFDEVVWGFKDFEFIEHGYQKYQRYAALQRAQSDNDPFVESLVKGLQKLENLSCVVMQDRWPRPRQSSNDPKRLSLRRPTGSPMARNWNLLHTEPKGWESMLEDNVTHGATNGADYYWATTCALIRSQRRIQTFEVGYPGVPAYCFDRTQVKSISFYGLDVAAFSGLKKLKLCIAFFNAAGETSESFPDFDGLRFLLGSMPHLEVLHLNLPAEDVDKPDFCAFNQVFPQQGHWSKLTTLSLFCFASSATDFLTLLIHRMPNLTNLELEEVELLTGSWEAVIECMMQSMHLLRFEIFAYAHLWHCGDTDLLRLDAVALCRKIEEYVKKGGRHPCLGPEEPDFAAQRYITEDLKCFCEATTVQKAYA